MRTAKHRMRSELPKLFRQELLNNLFRHPYTRIDYVQIDLGVTCQTAARYLDMPADNGFVEKHRAGKQNYYIDTRLERLLMSLSKGAYALSLKHRKRIEEAFGWAKAVGGMVQTVYRGVERVRPRFILTMAANNLARLPRLLPA